MISHGSTTAEPIAVLEWRAPDYAKLQISPKMMWGSLCLIDKILNFNDVEGYDKISPIRQPAPN